MRARTSLTVAWRSFLTQYTVVMSQQKSSVRSGVFHYAQFTPPTQTRLDFSCLGCVGGMNRIGDKSRLAVTESFETVFSSLEMWWGLLKTVLTCRKFCSHRRQDKTVLNCWRCEQGIRSLSCYVFLPVCQHSTATDDILSCMPTGFLSIPQLGQTRQSCLVLSVMWTRHKKSRVHVFSLVC